MNRAAILWCVAILSEVTFCPSALAEDEVAKFLTGKTVSEVISELDTVAMKLLGDAENSGSALLSNGANEAYVLAQNLRIAFRDDMIRSPNSTTRCRRTG